MLEHGFVDCAIYTRVRNGGGRGVMKGLGLIPFGYGHMLLVCISCACISY